MFTELILGSVAARKYRTAGGPEAASDILWPRGAWCPKSIYLSFLTIRSCSGRSAGKCLSSKLNVFSMASLFRRIRLGGRAAGFLDQVQSQFSALSLEKGRISAPRLRCYSWKRITREGAEIWGIKDETCRACLCSAFDNMLLLTWFIETQSHNSSRASTISDKFEVRERDHDCLAC